MSLFFHSFSYEMNIIKWCLLKKYFTSNVFINSSRFNTHFLLCSSLHVASVDVFLSFLLNSLNMFQKWKSTMVSLFWWVSFTKPVKSDSSNSSRLLLMLFAEKCAILKCSRKNPAVLLSKETHHHWLIDRIWEVDQTCHS